MVILVCAWLHPLIYFLSADHLEGLLKDEVTQPGFSSLPFKYMETSRLLLERFAAVLLGRSACPFPFPSSFADLMCWMSSKISASEDIPSPERVEGLLKDLREARQAKTRQGLEALNSVHIEVPRCCFSLSLSRIEEADLSLVADDQHLLCGVERSPAFLQPGDEGEQVAAPGSVDRRNTRTNWRGTYGSVQRLIALDPEEQGREEAGYLQDDEADAAADQTDADFLY